APARARRIHGKCYAASAARAAHDVALSVWHSTAAREGRVLLPRPYACDAAAGIFWQEGLAGRPILEHPDGAARLPGLPAEVGARLAALHDAPVGLPPEMDLAFQLAMLRRSLEAARMLPAPAARSAREVGERLLALGARFHDLPGVTLHGSLRLSHVMMTGS